MKQRPRIVSYDVWDTVIRRHCHPDAIKIFTARRALAILGDQVKVHLRDPWILFHLRQAMERDIGMETAAKGLDDEYKIADVIHRWVCGVVKNSSEVPTGIVERLIALEIEREKSVIYLDPLIAEKIRSDRATRRIFVSDFYMTKAQIYSLLAHVGVGTYFHDGYVSCDVGLNKRTGRLLEHVLDQEGVEGNKIWHIGDNKHSDWEMPRRLGIAAEHYLPETEQSLRQVKESRFQRRSETIRNLLYSDGSSLNGDEVKALAINTAPIFLGFALFIVEQVTRHQLDHLYFCTREGEFFLKLYEVFRSASRTGAKLPEGRILEVSRIATFGPSLSELSEAELMRLWNLYSIQSAGALIASLGLDSADFLSIFNRHELNADLPIKYPWDDPRIRSLLRDPEFIKQTKPILKSRRETFLRYCKERGLGS